MGYLTTSQYKLNKSLSRKWKTVGLNLSPAREAAKVLKRKTLPTMCPQAGTCADVCLVKTGMNVFPAGTTARARKTLEWVEKPHVFVAKVSKEIKAELQLAQKKGLKLAVRPNLLSDQPKLAHELARQNPKVQFYDYTKLPKPRVRVRDNYHLTYSVSERTTRADLQHCLDYGINMAIVVPLRKGAVLPRTFKVLGKTLPVVDGDADDLRFLDPEGCVVMLRWKGSKTRMQAGIMGGFVIPHDRELVR